MAALYWMGVVIFLAAGNTADAVDQNRLTEVVQRIRDQYKVTSGMFSVAVKIPMDQNRNLNVEEVFSTDNPTNVNTIMESGQVYTGNRVVAAKHSRNLNEHAEYRVVNNLSRLVSTGTADNMLLFYVYCSPCSGRCASNSNSMSILNRITSIMSFRDYAVVFTKIYKPNHGVIITETQLRDGLARLGAKVRLSNIFRCDSQCISCSDRGQVADRCIKT